MGWGPGKSRVIDEKRHFEKPIELSPLVAIDRERCILCYRCVRFSQEVAEDAAAAAARARRPHLRRHLRRPPLRRPLPRQHHRPLPGRGADQLHLPLPRPALGHRAGRLGLHALPEPVQRQLHRPRRAGEAGDRPRQPRRRRRLALRPRPLRLRDVRRRGAGRRAAAAKAARRPTGTRRSRRPPTGLQRGRRRQGRGDRRRRLQRGGLPGPAASLREALGSPHVDSRASRGPGREALVAPRPARALGQGPRHRRRRRDPRRSAPTRCTARRSSTCGSARRSAATAPGWRVATERPTTLDGGAEAIARYAPGEATHFLAELAQRAAAAPRTSRTPLAETPARRRARSSSSGASGSAARATAPSRPCSTLAAALDLAGSEGAGLLEVPDFANARGLREAGCLPDAGPGLDATGSSRRRGKSHRGDPRRPGVRRAQGPGPLRRRPAARLPRHQGLGSARSTAADLVVCLLDLRERDHRQGRRRLPARDPRRERRHRHPPRRPPAASPPLRLPPRRHPPQLQVLAELSAGPRPRHRHRLPAHRLRRPDRRGPLLRRHRRRRASAAAASAGRTRRSVARQRPEPIAASAAGRSARIAGHSARQRVRAAPSVRASRRPALLALGTYRDLWAGPITELNPPLKFLAPAAAARDLAGRRRAPRA